ncbi:MAG: carboxylesterase [bacterium]|nr:carboxylesterase [bacterium]
MTVYKKEPQEKAQACVIWLHGLGADASDMMGLVEQLPMKDVALRHIFMDAPTRPITINNGMVMPAWYDILGIQLADREDKVGIMESARLVGTVLEQQIKDGFHWEQIFLAGFSQGGAMALHTALGLKFRLGGVIALSAYLPLAAHTIPELEKDTPFFMGAGQADPIVLPAWSEQSKQWLLTHNYQNISFHVYPMQHSICWEEINDLSLWLTKQVQGVQ